MKCFIHENEDAVGVCKHCSKAVCKKCAVPNDLNFLVCSEACKQEAILYQVMMEKSKMAYGLKPGRLPATIIVYLLIGVVFVLFGFITISFSAEWVYGLLPLIFGVVFILGGAISIYNQRKSGLRV